MQHKRRSQCRIPCEIEHERRTFPGVVVDLAAGGLGLVTGVTLHEADSIRVRLQPKASREVVEVVGIVWNERVIERASARGSRRIVLGIMLSHVPPEYGELLATHGLREDTSEGPGRKAGSRSGAGDAAIRREDRVAASGIEIVHEPKADPALPRAKFPLPPQKPTPEERLPLYSARAKQRGGARTRRVEVRAPSAREAEDRLANELGEEWEILELTSIRRP